MCGWRSFLNQENDQVKDKKEKVNNIFVLDFVVNEKDDWKKALKEGESKVDSTM